MRSLRKMLAGLVVLALFAGVSIAQENMVNFNVANLYISYSQGGTDYFYQVSGSTTNMLEMLMNHTWNTGAGTNVSAVVGNLPLATVTNALARNLNAPVKGSNSVFYGTVTLPAASVASASIAGGLASKTITILNGFGTTNVVITVVNGQITAVTP